MLQKDPPKFNEWNLLNDSFQVRFISNFQGGPPPFSDSPAIFNLREWGKLGFTSLCQEHVLLAHLDMFVVCCWLHGRRMGTYWEPERALYAGPRRGFVCEISGKSRGWVFSKSLVVGKLPQKSKKVVICRGNPKINAFASWNFWGRWNMIKFTYDSNLLNHPLVYFCWSFVSNQLPQIKSQVGWSILFLFTSVSAVSQHGCSETATRWGSI